MTNQQPYSSDNASNPTNQKQRASDGPSPESAGSSREIHAPEPRTKNGKSSTNDKHWIDYVTAVFAFIAAVAAGAAAVFTGGQAWIAKDTENRQLRAYIGLIPPPDNQIVSNFTPPAKAVVRLTPHNFGQTPAYRAINWTGMGVAPHPLPKNFPYQTQKSPIGPNPITIHPGNFDIAGVVLPATEPLAQWDFDRIGDGKNWRLYAWGTITYDDAFGKSHFTNFCIGFYSVTAQQAQREPCIDHNDSD
ncbi:MAG: hypothetical protein ABSF34_19660 [Verrucomicrobiota bacterium]|jgi:hypothetical protein